MNSDGTQVENLPELSDYVEDDPDIGVETVYLVELYDEYCHLIGRLENGNAYPSETQCRFYLLKYPEADHINIKKVYRRVM